MKRAKENVCGCGLPFEEVGNEDFPERAHKTYEEWFECKHAYLEYLYGSSR